MTTIQTISDFGQPFGSARDQGTRPTCLAFAMSDGHVVALDFAHLELSCEFLFYHAKQRDGVSKDDGTTVSAIQDALEFDGQPAEEEWPYQTTLPGDWNPPSTISNVYNRASVSTNSGFGELFDQINAGSLAVIVMTLSPSFYAPDHDGVVHADEPVDPFTRHAVLATATGRCKTKRFVRIRNSWGINWGMGGYAWLSEKYLSPRIETLITLA